VVCVLNGSKKNGEDVESKPSRRKKKWRQRWLEDGENDLRELKVKRWAHKPNIREEWAFVLKWNNVEDLGVEK